MSEPEPSRLHMPSASGMGGALPPLTLPPLSLPPIKTDHYGLSPLGMSYSSYTPTLHSPSIASPSNHIASPQTPIMMAQPPGSPLASTNGGSRQVPVKRRLHSVDRVMQHFQHPLAPQDRLLENQHLEPPIKQLKNLPISPSNSMQPGPSTSSSIQMRFNMDGSPNSSMAPSPLAMSNQPSTSQMPNGNGYPGSYNQNNHIGSHHMQTMMHQTPQAMHLSPLSHGPQPMGVHPNMGLMNNRHQDYREQEPGVSNGTTLLAPAMPGPSTSNAYPRPRMMPPEQAYHRPHQMQQSYNNMPRILSEQSLAQPIPPPQQSSPQIQSLPQSPLQQSSVPPSPNQGPPTPVAILPPQAIPSQQPSTSQLIPASTPRTNLDKPPQQAQLRLEHPQQMMLPPPPRPESEQSNHATPAQIANLRYEQQQLRLKQKMSLERLQSKATQEAAPIPSPKMDPPQVSISPLASLQQAATRIESPQANQIQSPQVQPIPAQVLPPSRNQSMTSQAQALPPQSPQAQPMPVQSLPPRPITPQIPPQVQQLPSQVQALPARTQASPQQVQPSQEQALSPQILPLTSQSLTLPPRTQALPPQPRTRPQTPQSLPPQAQSLQAQAPPQSVQPVPVQKQQQRQEQKQAIPPVDQKPVQQPQQVEQKPFVRPLPPQKPKEAERDIKPVAVTIGPPSTSSAQPVRPTGQEQKVQTIVVKLAPGQQLKTRQDLHHNFQQQRVIYGPKGIQAVMVNKTQTNTTQRNLVPVHQMIVQQRLAPLAVQVQKQPTGSQAPPSTPVTGVPPKLVPGTSLAPAPSQPSTSKQEFPLSQVQIRHLLAQRLKNPSQPGQQVQGPPTIQQHILARNMQQQHRLIPAQLIAGQLHPSQANLPVRTVIQAHQQQLAAQANARPIPRNIGPVMLNPQLPQGIVVMGGPPRREQTVSINLAKMIDERTTQALSNKEQYRIFKKKFKYLVYENECYQEELRYLERKLLKLNRDKNFLLDRLILYEKFSDESEDDSDTSQKTIEERPKTKRRSRPSRSRKELAAAARSPSATPSPPPSPAPNLLTQMLQPSTSDHKLIEDDRISLEDDNESLNDDDLMDPDSIAPEEEDHDDDDLDTELESIPSTSFEELKVEDEKPSPVIEPKKSPREAPDRRIKVRLSDIPMEYLTAGPSSAVLPPLPIHSTEDSISPESGDELDEDLSQDSPEEDDSPSSSRPTSATPPSRSSSRLNGLLSTSSFLPKQDSNPTSPSNDKPV